MLPALLWLAVGMIAAVLTGMRVQVFLLERFPQGDWLVASAGLLVGGLVLGVVVVIVFTFASLKRTGLLLLGILLTVVVLGAAGMVHFPAGRFQEAQLAEEWKKLHPTLRLALWVMALEDWSMVVTDIVRTPEEEMLEEDSASPEPAVDTARTPEGDAIEEDSIAAETATDIARTPEAYAGMEQEPPDEAKHYVNEGGYAWAIDLRLPEAGPVRAWMRQGFFVLMGLETVRYEGKADHLHVTLPG